MSTCHGDPVVLDLWVCCPFHMFHQSIDRVDIGVGQPTFQFWAWMVGCWVGRLSFSSSSSFREVSVLKLPLVAHSIAVHSKEQGQFCCSQDLSLVPLPLHSYPTLIWHGPALLFCPGRWRVLSPDCCRVAFKRGRISSPALTPSGLTYLCPPVRVTIRSAVV